MDETTARRTVYVSPFTAVIIIIILARVKGVTDLSTETPRTPIVIRGSIAEVARFVIYHRPKVR